MDIHFPVIFPIQNLWVKKVQLQINYQPSYSKNKADQQTFDFDRLGGKIFRLCSYNFQINLKILQQLKMGVLLIVLATPGITSFLLVLTFSIPDWKATGYIPTVSNVDQSFYQCITQPDVAQKDLHPQQHQSFLQGQYKFSQCNTIAGCGE